MSSIPAGLMLIPARKKFLTQPRPWALHQLNSVSSLHFYARAIAEVLAAFNHKVFAAGQSLLYFYSIPELTAQDNGLRLYFVAGKNEHDALPFSLLNR
jgi:hypothetical protein